MEYVLTIWLMWPAGAGELLQWIVPTFADCLALVKEYTEVVPADGVIDMRFDCSQRIGV